MPSVRYPKNKERIELVDALRGFALAGIIFLHNIHHFNLIHKAEQNPEWLQIPDQLVSAIVAILFSGKAYAIFSMLFGFSFWIQYSHRKAKDKPFSRRFSWRMSLLFGFGIIHTIFYNGDILSFYALFSVVLIFTRKWSDKAVLFLAICFLLQPLEWIKFAIATHNPAFQFQDSVTVYNAILSQVRTEGSFWELVKLNFTDGQLANIGWVWEYGRFCQAPGLFLLGSYFARKKMFSNMSPRTWKKIGLSSFIVTVILIPISLNIFPYTKEHSPLTFVGIALWMYSSLSMTLVMLSTLCLCWYYFRKCRNAFGIIVPYGRMSLTNYITQSAIGTTIYFNYGFGLYKYCGPTLSLGIGTLTLLAQLLFSHWWLKNYKQGPLELLWKKATWIGSKKNPRQQTRVTEPLNA